jgi:hypothetical protein
MRLPENEPNDAQRLAEKLRIVFAAAGGRM